MNYLLVRAMAATAIAGSLAGAAVVTSYAAANLWLCVYAYRLHRKLALK